MHFALAIRESVGINTYTLIKSYDLDYFCNLIQFMFYILIAQTKALNSTTTYLQLKIYDQNIAN